MSFLERLTEEEKGKFMKEVHDNLSGSLKTKIQKVFPLEELEEAIKLAESKGSQGKVLLKLG